MQLGMKDMENETRSILPTLPTLYTLYTLYTLKNEGSGCSREAANVRVLPCTGRHAGRLLHCCSTFTLGSIKCKKLAQSRDNP